MSRVRIFSALTLLLATLCGAQPPAAGKIDEYRQDVKIDPRNSLAHFRIGEILLREHNLQGAATEFDLALRGDLKPAWTEAWSHLELGRIFDVTQQRERAISEYQQVLQRDDETFNALVYARNGLMRPVAPEDVFEAHVASTLDDLVTPTVLARLKPTYSEEGLLARVEGQATVAVLIAADGTPGEPQVLNGLGFGLDEAALESVRHWKFAPGTLKGEPVAQVARVDVDFRLPERTPGWHVNRVQFNLPDGARRPILMKAGTFSRDEMDPQLAEADKIDAAINRIPGAVVTMEIDATGAPTKIQMIGASMPIWGKDAVREVSNWRFRPASVGGKSIAVKCAVGLSWETGQ